MTPEELPRLYPRETLRWLRGRLGLTQLGLTLRLVVDGSTVAARLARLLAPHLATEEGADLPRPSGRGEASEG